MKVNARIAVSVIIVAVAASAGLAFLLLAQRTQPMTEEDHIDRPTTPRSLITPSSVTMPRLVIRKNARTLDLYDGDRLFRTYKMALGFAPAGDKEREGDGKTPEGEFYVFTKNPKSKFHLSLGLSYPSIEDAKRGLADGSISRAEHDSIVSAIADRKMPPQKTGLGGEIYIHGGGIEKDWTWGCIALKNEEIEELFEIIPVGTSVLILP